MDAQLSPQAPSDVGATRVLSGRGASRLSRFSGYLLSLAVGIAIGHYALDGLAWIERTIANCRGEAEPKCAPDRDVLLAVLDSGYESAEAAISGRPSPVPGYYGRVRRMLGDTAKPSPWLRMRLIGELGKSQRLEDCGFLFRYSQKEPKGWLKDLAMHTAQSMVIQDDSGGPETRPAGI